MNSKRIIYLDNNSTTPLDPRVLDSMLPYFTDIYSNASSTHRFGNIANRAVQQARLQVANLIGAEHDEIVFTSGSTEAINLAIKGTAESFKGKGGHIITVETEHLAVLDTCNYLEKLGYEVTYLPVERDGMLDLELLKRSIRKNTILISVMLVNNEIGVIQDIEEIANIAHSIGAVFFTDATQAVGKILIDVEKLGVDLLSLSAHKFYGPKGIGALFIKNFLKSRLRPTIHGGGQEKGLRSGTLNVPAIVGLGNASELALSEMNDDAMRIKKLRDQLETEILKISDTYLNGNKGKRLYNVSNICFPGINSFDLIMSLEKTIVSNGSACSSSTITPSHVLKAIGLTDREAGSSIRFSLGKFNTPEEIADAIDEVSAKVSLLRSKTQEPISN